MNYDKDEHFEYLIWLSNKYYNCIIYCDQKYRDEFEIIECQINCLGKKSRIEYDSDIFNEFKSYPRKQKIKNFLELD